MATQAHPRYIKVKGQVYKLAAEPALQEKLERIKQKPLQERQEKMNVVQQGLDKMKINLAASLVKSFAQELNEWVKTFSLPPPTKGDPNSALHAFVAFKDAFLEKNKEITDKALAKAAEVLRVPVSASTQKK